MKYWIFLAIVIAICAENIRTQQFSFNNEVQNSPSAVKQQNLPKINPKIQQTILQKDIELISSEIQLTEDALLIYEKKLEILQKIQQIYRESENKILFSSDEFLQDYLGEEKILKMIYNQFGSRYQQYESRKQSKQQQQLNQKTLANKITKKSTFNIAQNIKEVQFLNTFSYRSIQGNTLSYMVAAQLFNHTLFFFDLNGQQIIDPYIPGHKIHLMALAPKVDEVLIATLGTDNSIRIGRLENKKVKLNQTEALNGTSVEEDEFIIRKYVGNSEIPYDEMKNENNRINKLNAANQTQGVQYRRRNNTQLLQNSTLTEANFNATSEIKRNQTKIKILPNTTQQSSVQNNYRSRSQKHRKPEKYKYLIQREKAIRLIDYTNSTTPQESIYSSILQLTIKGTRLFLLGDKLGHIHTYHRNGTYKGKVKVANEPIIQLIKTYPNTIYATKSQIGQFNPLQQEVTPPICDQITDGIKEVQPDAVYNSHFYILTEKNEVIVIEMKNSDNTCRFKQKLNQLTIKSENGQQGQESGLLTIKNSLMVWNNKHNVLKVYNTTDIQQEQTELYEPFEIDIHKQQSYIEDTSVAFKFQKLSSTSSYILIHEKNPLSSNVTIYEVIIPQKQETDFINNIRLPILIVAVIVFILYQYFKKDQEEAKTSFEDFNLKADKQSNESEKKDDDNKKPLKAIEQGSRDSQDSNNSNPSTMDSIQNKYSQINLEPTKKSTQQTNRRNYVSRMHDIDDIDYRKHLHY